LYYRIANNYSFVLGMTHNSKELGYLPINLKLGSIELLLISQKPSLLCDYYQNNYVAEVA